MSRPAVTLRSRIRDASASIGRGLPVGAGDRRWIALALLPGIAAVAIYLATNPYPASGGGLYTKIAREIVANGFAPPTDVPGYTASGVPFAYPPLQFYLLAILLDLGADPLALVRILPGVAFVAASVVVYLIARDAIDSRPVGAIAATSIALNPQLIQWHVTAGGIVRAFALLYALVAVYAGYHVFGAPSRRSVAVGLVAFGLTLLTHPTYSLFVVASYLVFWVVRDRSVAGLGRGAVVGLGGLMIASPWLAWIGTVHGFDVFAAAAGTHGGVGGGLDALAGDVSPFMVVPLLGGAYLLYVRRYLLPVWLVVAELGFSQPRFAYAVGAIVVPTAGLRLARDRGWLEQFDSATAGALDGRTVDARFLVAGFLVITGTIVGGAYLVHEMSLVTDPSTPEYLDDDAVAAMDWTVDATEPDATFVVLGDAAEWYPALTDRTILIGPWGVEWVDAAAFDRHLETFDRVSACGSVECVESATAAVGGRPDYVYVPKGQYTIRGQNAAQFGTVERSFEAAGDWETAYENDGVVIYRRTATPS